MKNINNDLDLSPSDFLMENEWSVSRAQEIAYDFADIFGMEKPLKLIRFGENAVFKTNDEKKIIRVHRSNDKDKKIIKEVELAKELEKINFPSNRLAKEVGSQPVPLDGSYVTAWDFINESNNDISWYDVGIRLKEFHQGVTIFSGKNKYLKKITPQFNPFKRMHHWIGLMEDSVNISDKEKEILKKEYLELKSFFYKTNYMTTGIGYPYMHGDFYVGNIINSVSGPIFIDFELFAEGPSQWDLVLIAASHKRFNLSDDDYLKFCKGYGYDVRNWRYYENAMKIFELNAILWLVQNIDLKTHEIALNEFKHRIKNWTVKQNNDKWLISKEL